MRLKYCAGVLWVELGTDKPAMCWNLYNLHQVALGVGTNAHHTVLLVLIFVLVVKFITMAVTFANL